jgi:periplasmic protein TonB
MKRLRQGGAMQAAKVLNRVPPVYPHVAREEFLSSTVRLHAIIATDGTIKELRVMKGYCSLAKAAMEAVKNWRYSPTLFEGRALEIDTTIDVIFTLNR